MDKKQIKADLAEAARKGIRAYLSSMSGAHRCGANAEIAVLDYKTIQVACRGDSLTAYFVVSVKEGV